MKYFKMFKQPFYNEDDGLEISGNNAEVADPEPSDNVDIDNDEGEKETEPADPVKQNDDENSKYAAARREAERKAREAAQEASQLKRDNMIAKKYSKDYDVYSEADIKEKFGDRGINTLEELEAAIQEQQYREAGIDPELINQSINNHPIVKKASEYVQTLEQQRQEQQIKEDFERLHKEIPGTENIKTVEDLHKDAKWNDMWKYLEKGVSMPDAYYLTHKNEIVEQRIKASTQKQLNNINGKSHIKSDGNGVEIDGIVLDESEWNMAKMLSPNLTKQDYINFKKSQK